MPQGAGKYDRITTWVREETAADAVAVIVIGGKWGSGFSVQAPPAITGSLAQILRTMADGIERDLA